MKLLFINSLKGLKNKKIQMFGIIVMVLLSIAVYVGMNTAIDTLEDKYYSYLEEQNVEDISVSVNIDYMQDISINDIDSYLENELKDITEEEKILVYTYKENLKNNINDFKINYAIELLFNKYGITKKISDQKLDNIKEKYDFEYEYELSKTLKYEEILMKVMPYLENNTINKPYLIEGKMPINDGEVTILKGFASKNNLKIGDTYKIGDSEYKIVGLTYAPDYIYPLISFSMPIFDEKTNNIVFMNEEEYKNIVGIDDNSYAIKYNGNVERKFKISLDDEGKIKDNTGIFNIFNDENIEVDINTITRLGRISALQLEFASDRLFADYFLYFLLAISVLIIVIITKKRIEDERLQIGVLKSLGYNRFSIAVSYLTYPIIGSIIGGILGFILGTFVATPLANIFVSFYNVPINGININFDYLKTSLLVPTIILSLLSYLIALIMLRKKPLELLKEGSNLKVNIFSKIASKITSFFPFNSRFKLSLAFRSIGKLLLVAVTSFATGMLIILILICYNLFDNVIDKSFEGMKYKYMVMFNETVKHDEIFEADTDYILQTSMPLVSILNNDSSLKQDLKEEDITINLTGTDLKSNYLELYDESKDNIINILENDGIIINQNLSEIYNIKVGDKLKLEYQNISVTYEVLAISNELVGYSAYIRRSNLSESLGFNDNMYNVIYSNNDKYNKMSNLDKEEAIKIAYIMDLNSLKENIMDQMDRFNGSIYIIIIFASIMALVIIAVIASIVVEENKKTISLMKVMGYKNKQISNIVLNIYTPFIIVAYILSIPLTIEILKKIVSALVGDIEVTIPITIDPMLAIIGLIGLLIAYYVALYMAKKSLNKIPLSMALKRE